MADRFSISLRTVYRDVKSLDESGVPVIGEAGMGYTIMEGYRLPPVMFTQEEAGAILLGSKLAEKFTDGSVKKHFNAALFKIKAILRASDKEYVDNLTDHIEILARQSPASDGLTQYLSVCQQAIVLQKVVDLHYHSGGKEEKTRRHVEPIGLLYYSAAWHLIAWCRLRKGYRDFRLTRMLGVILKDESFDRSSHPSVQEYVRQNRGAEELQEVVLTFDKKVVRYLREQKYLNGYVSEEDLGDYVCMKFLTSSVEYFGRWLLMYGNTVTIESPAALRTIMKELSERLLAHHGRC